MMFARKLLVHLLFLFFDRGVGGVLGVGGDESRLLLRHTRLALLDRQAFRGPSFDLGKFTKEKKRTIKKIDIFFSVSEGINQWQ